MLDPEIEKSSTEKQGDEYYEMELGNSTLRRRLAENKSEIDERVIKKSDNVYIFDKYITILILTCIIASLLVFGDLLMTKYGCNKSTDKCGVGEIIPCDLEKCPNLNCANNTNVYLEDGLCSLSVSRRYFTFQMGQIFFSIGIIGTFLLLIKIILIIFEGSFEYDIVPVIGLLIIIVIWLVIVMVPDILFTHLSK